MRRRRSRVLSVVSRSCWHHCRDPTRGALGKPVVLNYRSGKRRITCASPQCPRHAPAGGRERRSSRFLVDVFGRFGVGDGGAEPIDLESFSVERDPLRPRLLSTRNLDALYDVACDCAFRIVQDRWADAC